jgi:hypothetical protein
MEDSGEKDALDEFGERDAFVLSGKRVEIEKGNRYRILWKDGSIYEGTYPGFLERNPLCRTVIMLDVIHIKESQVILEDEPAFYSFDKSGIICIDKIEQDLSEEPNVNELEGPDENIEMSLN